jgi:hypothetical protein
MMLDLGAAVWLDLLAALIGLGPLALLVGLRWLFHRSWDDGEF